MTFTDSVLLFLMLIFLIGIMIFKTWVRKRREKEYLLDGRAGKGQGIYEILSTQQF